MDTDAILERRRLRRRVSFWRVAALVILVLAIIATASLTTDIKTYGVASGGQIADIKLDGFIGTRPEAAELLKTASETAAVKAILLHIDSGGGAASGGAEPRADAG